MFGTRALAVRKVVTNQGGKTPGIDNQIWDTPESRFKAIGKLGVIVAKPHLYVASPVKRVYIPKPGTKERRPLGIPTLTDRAVQALYHMAVDPVVECYSDPNSYGFRSYRSAQDAITTLRSLLDKAVSPQWVFETDIAKCFDKIDQRFLIENTPICDKSVLSQWLESGVQIGGQREDVVEGTPQGGIISPMLCNVALNGLEAHILKHYHPRKVDKSTKMRPKVYVIRYADDIVITGSSREILERVRPILEDFLKVRGLTLKEAKTRIIHIQEGFDFLGFNIRRFNTNPSLNRINSNQNTTLVIAPSKRIIDRVKAKVQDIIQTGKPIESIIRDLNPILRGWSEYFRISYHSQEVFITLSHYVWNLMLRWASRRHPGEPLKEIINRYLQHGGSHKWTWGVSVTETLFNLAEVTTWIMRPLKLSRNPYLLENREYFEKRREGRIAAKFRATVYKKFNHTCPTCEESLHNGEPVELHHIVPVQKGGKYSLTNIQPLHRVCHQKITYQKQLKVR